MRDFIYLKPGDSAAALAELSARGEGVAVLAGGTDLLVRIKDGLAQPACLLDLAACAELRAIEPADGCLAIGALATMRAIAASKLVRELCPALAEAAGPMGGPQIRNRATIGGNIVTASPSADGVPPLLAAGARVEVWHRGGRRELTLEEFIRGYRRVDLQPGEVLARIKIPNEMRAYRSAFLKVGRRSALAIAVVNLAAAARLASGLVADIRIVLGAVGPRALRAEAAEAYLKGKALTAAHIAVAAGLAAAAGQPIDDVRATAGSRTLFLKAWTGQLLGRLAQQ